MSTKHLIDPDLLPGLEMFPGFEFTQATLEPIRAAMAAARIAQPAQPLEAQVRIIAGPAGPLEVYWFDPHPGHSGRAALLHIHGGGMVIGSVRNMQAGPSTLAANLGIPVASVEYRLAPETPFPGPQEDCLAALSWLAENAADLGIDPDRIAICGESAGGGLAAAVALMARDKGGPKLAAQILTYPMLDHRTGSADCHYSNRTTGEFIWTRASNQFGWEALRGTYEPTDYRKAWFSPSLADDLDGLPPTWIGIGALDLFLDEDIEYARRLASAGVEIEFHCYPGAYHGFNMFPQASPTRAYHRDLSNAITRVLSLEPQQ
ncbi:alpha/beta hydrolase [Novosphingobium sp.]|uniref:alpha/beta hydrolase n=1 Tax=Novosphingobium sp. TaxID=1874826 RepID=UPI0025D80767|nr:alpha/beta hydrolase [Novosphingobium sp.]